MSDFMSPMEVQWFLDGLGGAEFVVTYLKKDDSQSQIVGRLAEGGTKKDQVPVKVDYGRGWKSFNINRVLSIGYACDFPGVCERIREKEGV